MKNSVIISLITLVTFFTILSCRTTKEKSESLQMALTQERIGSHSQVMQELSILDSANRAWYFRSDGSFYYHPDSGLYAHNGILSFWEEDVKSKQWLYRQDSNYQRATESVDTQFFSTYSKKVSPQRWISIIGMLLLLACGYGIFYIKKRLRR